MRGARWLAALPLAACAGYEWGAEARGAGAGAGGLPVEDLTGAPGLASALVRAAPYALAACPPVVGARLAWGAPDAEPLGAADAAAPLRAPPPRPEALTLTLRFAAGAPVWAEVVAPRLDAPLGAHPSTAEEGLGGAGALDGLVALLARKAGDACALRR